MELLFTIILLNVIIIGLICKSQRLAHQKQMLQAQEKVNNQLLYVRSLIDLVYTYQHRPELLLIHFQLEMSIKKLLIYHLIEDRCDHYCPEETKLNQNDKLFYMLCEEGFSARELCVIFGQNNINSVYVRHHRIRKKLQKESCPAQRQETEQGEISPFNH